MPNETWDPTTGRRQRGRKPSESVKTLYGVSPGETMRIIHPDVNCTIGEQLEHPGCSLVMAVYNLQKKHGRRFEYYHEGHHCLVIRRLS
jgi:hypothetical protein